MSLVGVRPMSRLLSARLATAVGGTATASGFTLAKLGVADGVVPPALLSVAALVVGVGCFAVGIARRPAVDGLIVAAGPVVGFGAYLAAHRLLVGPTSGDSPTWLLFVALAAGALGLGAVAVAAGRLVGPFTSAPS